MPRAPLGLRRLLLCLFIPAMVACLFLLCFSTLHNAPVTDLKSYSGTLTHSRNATTIYLPPGIRLKNLFANDGDTVSKGQTIGIIDTVALKKKIDKKQRDLLAKKLLKTCLIGILTDISQAGIVLPPITPSILAVHKDRAAAECEVVHAHKVNQDITFTEKQNILNHRLSIAQNTQSILIQAAKKRGTEVALIDALILRSLENATAITTIQQALSDLTLEYREAATLFHQRQTAKIANLTKEIMVLEQDLSTHEDLLKKPLIRAPAAGTARILQSDRMPEDQPNSDRPVIDITTDGPSDFRVAFFISEQDAAETPIGSRVDIRQLGAAAGRLALSGEISGYYANNSSPGSETQISAHVTLTADSTQRLVVNMSQLSYTTQNAATVLHVAKAPRPLGDVLSQQPLVIPFIEKISQLEQLIIERFSKIPVEDQNPPTLSAIHPIAGAG